ncbi:MAG: formylglycine-generating enzyme family protein [Planctomycetota bacterium]
MAQSEKEITNSIGMKLMLIPKGSFLMGSLESEEFHREEEVQHEVTLSSDFYLGITEVTQAQYQKVIGENPSYFEDDKVQGDSSNHPVERVSWGEAVEFCKKLSDLPEEKGAGRVYRLPTEAEWEYACRAGSKSAYSFGDKRDSLDDYAWHYKKVDDKTHPVGQKKPNAWGLYDMHGNVWEWCIDWYGDYPKGAVSDPVGPNGGWLRVIRGGSWDGGAAVCRSAFRGGHKPSLRLSNGGFRVALSSPEIPK